MAQKKINNKQVKPVDCFPRVFCVVMMYIFQTVLLAEGKWAELVSFIHRFTIYLIVCEVNKIMVILLNALQR